MQSVAENLGLARLWTNEAAPFWKRTGLLPANADALRKLPEAWGVPVCDWLTLQLRDEVALQATLDAKFVLFQEEERRLREETLRKARAWKALGVTLSVIVAIAGVLFCIFILTRRPFLFRH
jgi:hypothetical protein